MDLKKRIRGQEGMKKGVNVRMVKGEIITKESMI
jgi:hypothetical protein